MSDHSNVYIHGQCNGKASFKSSLDNTFSEKSNLRCLIIPLFVYEMEN